MVFVLLSACGSHTLNAKHSWRIKFAKQFGELIFGRIFSVIMFYGDGKVHGVVLIWDMLVRLPIFHLCLRSL
jgi:hypothetical protein